MTNAASSSQMGNMRRICGGRALVGPEWRYLVATIFLITTGSLIFVFYTNHIEAGRIFVSIFACASLCCLLTCGFSDPGVILRQPPLPPNAMPRRSQWREQEYVNRRGGVGRVQVELKWCYSCNIYRPHRAVHCRYCDVCILRRDHHCPWTGTCIGQRNYTSYFFLLWSLTALLTTASIAGGVSFVERLLFFSDVPTVPDSKKNTSPFVSALIDTYCLEFILLFISVLWGILVMALAVQHTYLMTQNMTSADAAGGMADNIFSRGSLCANVAATICDRDSAVDPTEVEVVICDEQLDQDDAREEANSPDAMAPHRALGGDDDAK